MPLNRALSGVVGEFARGSSSPTSADAPPLFLEVVARLFLGGRSGRRQTFMVHNGRQDRASWSIGGMLLRHAWNAVQGFWGWRVAGVWRWRVAKTVRPTPRIRMVFARASGTDLRSSLKQHERSATSMPRFGCRPTKLSPFKIFISLQTCGCGEFTPLCI